MDFKEFFQKYDAQAKIDKLARRYKNRKIVLYGAGQYATILFENYDLSKLNIIAVADIKFENEEIEKSFFGYRGIAPAEIKDIDCNLILISNFDYNMFLNYLDSEILYGTKKAGIEIRPLIRLGFKDLFLK